MPDDLPTKVADLLGSELMKYCLQIVPAEHGRGIVCTKALREGDVVCNVSMLLYDAMPTLQAMLSIGGHKFLADRVVRIDGLLGPGSGDKSSALHGVPVGAAGYFQHW